MWWLMDYASINWAYDVLMSFKIMLLFLFLAILAFMNLAFFPGRKSKNDPDTTFCGWSEYVGTDIVWYPIACCNWSLLHVCTNNPLNCLGWSIQWPCRSSGGSFLTPSFLVLSSLQVFECITAEIWEDYARDTGCSYCCVYPSNCSRL